MSWCFFLFVLGASGIHVARSQCNPGSTGPINGDCLPCEAGTYLYKEHDDSFQNLLRTNTPYIVSDAKDWNTTTQRFDSMCGNQVCQGNTGALEAGAVATGTVQNNGARIPVAFVGGNTASRMQWGPGSIPAAFTICSVTRYSGGARGRILNAQSNSDGSRNWLHGHYASRTGVNYYSGWIHGGQSFPLDAITDWVAMCASNSPNTNGLGKIVNGIISSDGRGGTGSCALGINHAEVSDWQLSKVYVWNTHLLDEDLTLASLSLHSALFTDTTAAGVCLPCQANSQSQAGASVCECNAGYTGQNGWFCNICPSNMFKSEVGPDSCTSCPANAASPSGSTIITNCRCRVQYFGVDGGVCTACPANSRSVAPSPDITICQCNANYFGPYGEGCTLCPSNSESVAGSTVIADCKCKPGYFEDDEGVCSIPVCPVGKYSSAPDHAVCEAAAVIPSVNRYSCNIHSDCNYPNCKIIGLNAGCWLSAYQRGPNHKKCWRGPSEYRAGHCHSPLRCIDGCYECPPNTNSSIGSNHMIDCKCNAGSTGRDGSACRLCEAGKYKTLTGSVECSSCLSGYDSFVGSTTEDDCFRCEVGFYSPGAGQECLACPLGTYKDFVGNSACLTCPSNSIAPSIGSTTCIACENSFTIGDGRKICSCKAGYVDNRGAAVYIDGWVGEHYALNGAMQSSGYTGFDALTPDHTTKLLTIYYPNRDTFPWRQDNYAIRFHGIIRIVEAGLYAFHLNSDDGSFLWVNEIFTIDNGGTHGMQVRTGTAELPVGDHNVRVHFFQGGGGAGVILHYTGPGISGLVELPAYTKTGGCVACVNETEIGCVKCAVEEVDSCFACPAGSYKNKTDDTHCTSCPSGKYTATTGNVNSSSFGRGATSFDMCVQCQEYAHPFSGMRNNYTAGFENCTCMPGYSGADGGGTCYECEIGKYKDESGSATCTQCTENSGKQGVANTICSCDAGYSGPGNAHCVACDMGFYKDTSGSAPCTSCPFRLNSTAASMSEGDCNTCNAGKYISREILQVQYKRSAACAFDINGDFDDIDVMYNGFPMYQHVTRPELFIWYKGGFVLNHFGWGYVLGPHPINQSLPYAYSSANSEIELRNGTSKWRQQCTSTDQIGQWMILDETIASVVGGSCALCGKGKFSNTLNVAECTACDTTSYSDTIGATVCTKCPVMSNVIANTERTLCGCRPGWTLPQTASDTQRGECQQCAAGEFKNKTGDEACLPCENVKTQGGVATCVDVVSFSLFLTELSENQYDALRSSIAQAFGLPADMVEMTVKISGSRRLLSPQVEIVVSISIPIADASANAPPPIPDILNVYKNLAEDQFVAAIIPGTTVLIDGSMDGVHLAEMFEQGMLLRRVLDSNIGGGWSAGDKVFVRADGQQGLNDEVLTYMGAAHNDAWSPANCEPVLASNSTYMFFLQGASVHLYRQI